jgi:hypothetical protein
MVTAAGLLDVLAADPDAPVCWGTLDDRLDAEARTLPPDRDCLMDVIRAMPPHRPLVAWHEGPRPVLVRTWLPQPDGGIVLYLDVAD